MVISVSHLIESKPFLPLSYPRDENELDTLYLTNDKMLSDDFVRKISISFGIDFQYSRSIQDK